MPSKNMLPKGKRRQTVKHLYRAQRGVDPVVAEGEEPAETSPGETPAGQTPAQPKVKAPVPVPVLEDEDIESEGDIRSFSADAAAAGLRLDAYLAKAMPDISRGRVQLLIEQGQVRVDGKTAKNKLKLLGGERIEIEGEPRPAPLKAMAEDIPLKIVYEDEHMAVIDKPAGMMVHAGSGLTDDARSGGTLVNALLHHFNVNLSSVGGELRPGIVHRLDKQTSGLIMVAKNDRTHRALGEMFSDRSLEKRYLALVHGEIGAKARGNAERDRGTINLPIGRDPIRRTRMTTRSRQSWMTTESPGTPSKLHPEEREPMKEPKLYEARAAVSHYEVLERLDTSAGKFTLLEVLIETGRTHQIRVHMQAIGHPVVGDTLYGAPARIVGLHRPEDGDRATLPRNFLHAKELRLAHPITGEELDLEAELPADLTELLDRLRSLPPKPKE